jgi:hypothetical protein
MTSLDLQSMKLEQDSLMEIRQLHQEICSLAMTALDKAIRIGELLLQEKAKLKHGEWLPWIKENLPFSHNTVNRYKRCYQYRDRLSNYSNLNNLSVDGFLRLCSTPRSKIKEEVTKEISKANDKIQVIEREKEVLEAELEEIVQDEDFSNEIERVVEEGEEDEEDILSRRKVIRQKLRDDLVLREEVSEKQLIKHVGEYWDHLLIHFSKWDRKRLAKLTIQFLLKKYPQLNDEGI